jgi:hypothetical protein
MSEIDDLGDAELGSRLASALGETPPRLAFRLDRLAAVGLQGERAKRHRARPWADLAPRTASAALRFALCAGATPLLWGLFVPSHAASASLPFGGLAIPAGLLLLMEALRGAPTVRALLRS